MLLFLLIEDADIAERSRSRSDHVLLYLIIDSMVFHMDILVEFVAID